MENFATLDQALEDLRQGNLILVIDDPDRENEGDLICAAEFATTENVNCYGISGQRSDLYAYEQRIYKETGTGSDGSCEYG